VKAVGRGGERRSETESSSFLQTIQLACDAQKMKLGGEGHALGKMGGGGFPLASKSEARLLAKSCVFNGNVRQGVAVEGGTQFTCFIGTTVQFLTQLELQLTQPRP
jgi:hypothetical protein